MLKDKIIFGLLMLPMVASFASDEHGWDLKDPNSGYHQKMPGKFIDDALPDQMHVELTKEQKLQARIWRLEDGQYARYLVLKKNKTGTFIPEANPIVVLGVNSRNNDEREGYARLLAQIEFEQTAKYLAFNSEYQKQANLLRKKMNLPIIRQFDTDQFSPYAYNPIPLKKDDKLFLYAKSTDSVDAMVRPFIKNLKNKGSQLNIFFTDTPGDEKIQAWGRAHSLPLSLVKEHIITLNNSLGQYNKFKKDSGGQPILILLRNGKSTIIDLGRF